jgi:hypothetical protein
MSMALRNVMALWLVSFPGLFVPADEGVRHEAGQRRATPFRLVSGFLVVVEGSVGKLDRLNFVIDTGTNRTVIHDGVARTLGLARTRSEVYVFGDRTAADAVVAPLLVVGPLRAVDLPVLVQDLQPQVERLGFRPDALIGTDVLGTKCVTIDFVATTLTFECVGEPDGLVAFEPRSKGPVVEAVIEGSRYRLIVDSGSEATVIFRSAIPSGRLPRIDEEIEAAHLNGPVRLRRFTARRFTLGQHVLTMLPVFIIDGSPDSREYDGVLAPVWLPGTRVCFDFERRVLGWQ